MRPDYYSFVIRINIVSLECARSQHGSRLLSGFWLGIFLLFSSSFIIFICRRRRLETIYGRTREQLRAITIFVCMSCIALWLALRKDFFGWKIEKYFQFCPSALSPVQLWNFYLLLLSFALPSLCNFLQTSYCVWWLCCFGLWPRGLLELTPISFLQSSHQLSLQLQMCLDLDLILPLSPSNYDDCSECVKKNHLPFSHRHIWLWTIFQFSVHYSASIGQEGKWSWSSSNDINLNSSLSPLGP